MIITDKFVFIHMPKAGGTFVTSALKKLHEATGEFIYDTNDDDYASKHAMLGGIPEEHRHKPVLLNIRNPFSHLVSMYKFKWWYEEPDAYFDVRKTSRKIPSFPHMSFTEFVLASNDWSLVKVAPWMEKLKTDLIKHDIGALTMWYLPGVMQNTPNVVYNFNGFINGALHGYYYPQMHVARCENLNEDLFHFLMLMDYNPDDIAFILEQEVEQPLMRERGRSQEVYLKSKLHARHNFVEYYTPELVKHVLYKERAIFKLFPYYKNTFDAEWFEKQYAQTELMAS